MRIRPPNLTTLSLLTLGLIVCVTLGLAPATVHGQSARDPGSLVIGASYGYGLGGVHLEQGEGSVVRHETNFTNGYLRGAFFISSRVAVGVQYNEWKADETKTRPMRMRLTAATVTWYPTEGVFAYIGVGSGDVDAELGLLDQEAYSPDTPPDERPATSVVTQSISHNAVGFVLAGGYELLLTKSLGLGIQLDMWYLETLEHLSSLVSSVSLNANIYLW